MEIIYDILPDDSTIQPSITSIPQPMETFDFLSNTTQGPNEFLLKRVVKSIAYAIAQQAVETDLPDRHIGSVISYLISPFALLCMAMAIILNRTVVFATTRRPTALSLSYRVLLRLVAVFVLAKQTIPLFQALECATGSNEDMVAVYLRKLLSKLGGGFVKCPNPPILWDLYRSICIGHFIETFSSVIQGRVPYSETGMTLFEYSVAFQEVQSSSKLSMEILIVSILSSLSQISLHVQGMFNSFRFRLIPSSVFGITFLCYFAYATYQGRLLYFPTVCVIGYLPQLAILIIVLICVGIYGLACTFVGGADKMQTSIKSFNMDLSDDFYTCLMKLGILALTSVTEATYLSETASLAAPLSTWIEHFNAQKSINRPQLHRLSPYANEIAFSPKQQQQQQQKMNNSNLGPSGFVTLNRLISAAQMIQALVYVGVKVGLKFLKVGARKIFKSNRNHDDSIVADDEEDEEIAFSNRLQKIRNQLVYSSLHDDYASLLQGDLLPDFDDSNDYIPENDDDDDDAESDGDYEGEIEIDFDNEVSSSNGLNEFYDLVMSSPDHLFKLLAPQSNEDAEEAKILSSHLSTNSNKRLTRSQYQDMFSKADSTEALLKLIVDKRNVDSDDHDQGRESLCVVCRVNPRQVVLWPCRCFALCEDCRLGLAVKNFKGCVCCRRPVESFSRIFVP